MSKLLYKKSLYGSYDFRLDDGYCIANCGLGKDWCTVYLIMTEPSHQGQGEAQKMLAFLKERCLQTNRELRVWIPNEVIEHICKKLGIKVADDEEDSPYKDTEIPGMIHEVLGKLTERGGVRQV